MRVLVGCESSQIVCAAFRDAGHEAFSCDLRAGQINPDWHIQDDLMKVLNDGWDLLIGHPPCTFLSYAGIAHWNRPGRLQKRLEALAFFGALWEAPIEKICLENPKGCASPTIAKYTQEIQPYYFGDSEIKTTWLWLKNLPPLVHRACDTLFESATHTDRPMPTSIDNTDRKKKRYFTDSKVRDPMTRSNTFPGIARAMVHQWGG